MKKFLARDSYTWLYIAIFLYLCTWYMYFMADSWGAFHMMASHSLPEDTFSLWELMQLTWERWHLDWSGVLLFSVPAIVGFLIFVWRRTWLTFIMPSLYLCFCIYCYLVHVFSGSMYISGTLRKFPEYLDKLPWWFHLLRKLPLLGG